MSAGRDTELRLLARGTRAVVITGLFLCAGPLLEIALPLMLIGYGFAVSSVFSYDLEAVSAFFIFIYIAMMWLARELSWLIVVPDAAMAALVGLIVGVDEALSGRLNVWTTVAVSVAIRIVWILSADLASIIDPSTPFWPGLTIEAVVSLSFVLSMVLCWKIARLVRLKTPAVARLSPA
jgi:hypothetical protein